MEAITKPEIDFDSLLEGASAESMDGMDTLTARIAELEAERRWIPVSEKPTKSDWYLIMYQGYAAPVTRGVIDTARQAAYLPDADVVINGHNHQEYVVTLNRIKLSPSGVPYEQYQHFIRTPGYKKAGLVNGDMFGFDIEKMPAPTTRGCVRLDFNYSHGEKISNKLDISPVALLS